MRVIPFLLMVGLLGGASGLAAGEVVTLPARSAELPEGVVWAAQPVVAGGGTGSGETVRLRFSMHDMADVIERRLKDGVEELNAFGAELRERAETSSDSPGYAADWLLWREMLGEMRTIHSWEEHGAPLVDVEPPRPTAEALEAHFLIERERTGLEQSRERHRLELAELRATGEMERAALESEILAREREERRARDEERRWLDRDDAWFDHRFPVFVTPGHPIRSRRPVSDRWSVEGTSPMERTRTPYVPPRLRSSPGPRRPDADEQPATVNSPRSRAWLR